jgi:hypothetical protein
MAKKKVNAIEISYWKIKRIIKIMYFPTKNKLKYGLLYTTYTIPKTIKIMDLIKK